MHNPYAPPRARVQDAVAAPDLPAKTTWGRATRFYWALLWRMLLIFCGMMLPFLAIYGFIQWILSPWPLFERLVRLVCILTLLTLAFCWAIQWAAKLSVGGFRIRVLTPGSADPMLSLPMNGITFGQAAKLFGAHLWRYVLVLIPLNVLLQWVAGRMNPVPATGWTALLEMQSINFAMGLVVGVWAMREALSVTYNGFRLAWVVADSNGVETPPATPLNS